MIYLPTFSEIQAWDFYPGSAGIFEDDMIISEDSRRSPKSSEDVRSFPKTSEVCEGEVIEKTLIHIIWDREEGIVIYSFYTWFSFLTWVWDKHIFGNCVKQDGNNSHFSIRREKLARKREPEWDRSFQPSGVRLTPKAWELAGITLLQCLDEAWCWWNLLVWCKYA